MATAHFKLTPDLFHHLHPVEQKEVERFVNQTPKGWMVYIRASRFDDEDKLFLSFMHRMPPQEYEQYLRTEGEWRYDPRDAWRKV